MPSLSGPERAICPDSVSTSHFGLTVHDASIAASRDGDGVRWYLDFTMTLYYPASAIQRHLARILLRWGRFEQATAMLEVLVAPLALTEGGHYDAAIRIGCVEKSSRGCLLWSYTAALGIVVLAGCVIALSIPSVLPGSLRSVYRRTPHLQGQLTCGVNDAEMWVRGASFQCRSQWSNLHVWRESAGWLVLNPHGLLPIFLRIDDRNTAGCYDPIVALARANGRQFGSHVDLRG